MTLREFLNDQSWDAPFFKILAHNDTGQASGNQAGFLIPKELRKFFPALDEAATSAARPTTDRTIMAELYEGTTKVADTNVRYQFQTWGGTRRAESRLTDNLTPLRNKASKKDLVVLQRRRDALNRFRVVLVMKGSTAFQGLRRAIGDRRWGALFTNQPPITQKELEHAAAALHATVITPFELTKAIRRADTVHQRIIRDVAFATIVRAEYKYTCCISGIKIATPAAFYEVEASHVVPVADGGTDDPRNGIALSRSLHWAFDRGLFGIMPDRRVYIPQQVRSQENRFLNALAGRRIKEATNPQYRVHDDALAWHLERYVRQWE